MKDYSKGKGYAGGGIINGPIVGLMGEPINNPEVIAPLNKLKELINAKRPGHRQQGTKEPDKEV